MQTVSQSPTDDSFVQNPYPSYAQWRALGDLVWWSDYDMPVACGYEAVSALLRDRRFGREQPAHLRAPTPQHLTPFYDIEAHSMLELEPPRHTRLRGLVLRAFTSRRIAALEPEIVQLCHELIDAFPNEPFDLLTHYAQRLPVIIIARFLGVPETMWRELLAWSNAMVGMYQAGRTRAQEEAAVAASIAFSAFLGDYIEARRKSPRDDLISHLIAAEEDGDKLSREELISTCILLLNAGHEATVHTIGNGVKALLEAGHRDDLGAPACVEEILRFDAPLHMFTRYALQDVEVLGYKFACGDQVGLMLGAANRDPLAYPDPDTFNPNRKGPAHASFGAGLHFCVGAPLARLELAQAIPILFERCPELKTVEASRYASTYHFHGLETLILRA
jgi:cytochrome P450